MYRLCTIQDENCPINDNLHNLKIHFSSTCNMCQVDVYGFNVKNDSKIHRQSYAHQMLKEFLHPSCSTCKIEFQQRKDWDAHKFSFEHLTNLTNEGVTEVRYT